MPRRRAVPLRAAFFVGIVVLLLLVAAVMLEPAVLGAFGDVFREPASAVDANWVLLAAVAFPGLMLVVLLVLRGAA
ncbi:hypothetical protein N0B31_05490 [Salinirubellus salinus]|uniref:Uncharacterized protein n=1 Tax=Salinirubellus salinus TaxID=1364945 RepID=A0A9E7R515_9EURY|nr:hypothetical protein [Salinirubellus salinus]UWM55737.1 hypothetical protein N0B31_05490 [Salinirubellus salinus]